MNLRDVCIIRNDAEQSQGLMETDRHGPQSNEPLGLASTSWGLKLVVAHFEVVIVLIRVMVY